jgi:hypothetical protein
VPDPIPPPIGELGQTPPPLPPLPPSTPSPVPLPAPLPVESLDYYTPQSNIPPDWVVATRCRSVGEWHSLKASLQKANIVPMINMTDAASPRENVELLVQKPDLQRADLIIKAHRLGIDWCPRCGSTAVKKIPLRWYWKTLDLLLLGMLLYMPPGKECQSCGNKWG